MPRTFAFLVLGSFLLLQGPFLSANTGKKMSAREALHPFNELIGQWKGTGRPKGTPQQIQKGFWIETQEWAWKFKGEDAWLTVDFDKGKYFKNGELRYLPDSNEFQFVVETTDKKKLTFSGTFEDRWLILLRQDQEKKETQKLIIRLLHPNRFLYMYDVQPEGKAFFTRLYEVGVTKQGEEFASGDGRPECIVSGGLGTMEVKFQGKTYYVCCTGCRDEFYEAPQKYIQEAEKKKKK